MSLAERYQRNMLAAAEARLGEHVVFVTTASRPGSMRAVLSSDLLNVGGAAFGWGSMPTGTGRGRIFRRDGKDTRLPISFVVAVTPTEIHFYKHRMFWGSVKLKRELGCFSRKGLEVHIADDSLMWRFVLRSHSEGQLIGFEMMRSEPTRGLAAVLRESA